MSLEACVMTSDFGKQFVLQLGQRPRWLENERVQEINQSMASWWTAARRSLHRLSRTPGRRPALPMQAWVWPGSRGLDSDRTVCMHICT